MKIEGIKKVTLSFEAGTTEERMDLTPGPKTHEFVSGIGADGLTPFEYALLGKGTGDVLVAEVHRFRRKAFFGHIDVPLPSQVRDVDTFFLKVNVASVADVGQTELVRAMASAVGDCGGNCCGHH